MWRVAGGMRVGSVGVVGRGHRSRVLGQWSWVVVIEQIVLGWGRWSGKFLWRSVDAFRFFQELVRPRLCVVQASIDHVYLGNR